MKNFIKLSDLKLQKTEMLKVTGGANDVDVSTKMFPVRLYGIVVLYAVNPAK